MINPLQHPTNLQQMTLKTSIDKKYVMNRVGNVAKGEITHHENLLFLAECFQKSSRGLDKRE